MLEFEINLRIERPVDEVFAFLADFENTPKWNYYVLRVTKTSPGPAAVGTTYHQVRKSDEQDYRISALESPRRIAVESLPGSSPRFKRQFTLEAEGQATRLVDTWALDTGRPRLIEKLAGGRIKAAVTENLGKLKTLLETGSATLQDGRQVSR